MNVIIIDDEPAMHLILNHMLAKIENVEVMEAFRETAGAYTFLQNNNVDLAFVDISMPRENGLDFAKRLRECGNQIKLVFVTSHKEYSLSAFDVYAYDYIVKPISQIRLNQTLERALSEEVIFKEKEPAAHLIEPLTKREKEVLQLMSNGLSNKEIADTYQLTEGTIKNHMVNIFGKLQVKNRVQAMLAAKALNQIS